MGEHLVGCSSILDDDGIADGDNGSGWLLADAGETDTHVEGHARLDHSLIHGVNQQLPLLIVEADAEPEACRDVEVGVALHDQVLGHHVGLLDGLADC